jgi:hypothetical protein
MTRTYREIAIEEMLRTVEEAMSEVINWWGDLPPPMKEAIEQFRTQLGTALIGLRPALFFLPDRIATMAGRGFRRMWSIRPGPHGNIGA